jgi:hypothetical protein
MRFKSIIKRALFKQDEITLWQQRGFSLPAPQEVKLNVLKRHGGQNLWIETGTYEGTTTKSLAEFAKKVISIEPSLELSQKAKKKFSNVESVTIVTGTSEESLDSILNSLNESELSDVTFWLDGHFSDGFTFKGKIDTPIVEELGIICSHLGSIQKITILIDDVRCFKPNEIKFSHYPSLSYLVNWAQENKFEWQIEQDIFIISNRA